MKVDRCRNTKMPKSAPKRSAVPAQKRSAPSNAAMPPSKRVRVLSASEAVVSEAELLEKQLKCSTGIETVAVDRIKKLRDKIGKRLLPHLMNAYQVDAVGNDQQNGAQSVAEESSACGSDIPSWDPSSILSKLRGFDGNLVLWEPIVVSLRAKPGAPEHESIFLLDAVQGFSGVANMDLPELVYVRITERATMEIAERIWETGFSDAWTGEDLIAAHLSLSRELCG